MTTLTVGDFAGFATLTFEFEDTLVPLQFANPLIEATPTLYAVRWRLGGESRFHGQDLAYDEDGKLVGGRVTGWEALGANYEGTPAGETYFSLEGLSLSASTVTDWLFRRGDPPAAQGARAVLFAGNDSIAGGPLDDALWGDAGDDTISGGGGDDVIGGNAGASYLRGGGGNDLIQGDVGFDNINGNQGDDTASGGGGADWVLGGQGDDLLRGGYGDDYDDEHLVDAGDILNGNLGKDTVDGGAGADTIRGGQGDDSLTGGAGDDYISGDLGDDTLAGGSGADIFRAFGGGGSDRITDFDAAEGDRIQMEADDFVVRQMGADTVIDIADWDHGGGRIVLAGVSMDSLTGFWMFQ